MSWVVVGLTVGSAGMKYMGAKNDQKNQKIQNDLQAQLESTSWATGRGGNPTFNAQNPYVALMEGAAQGALTGVAQGQKLNNSKSRNQFNEANEPFSIYSKMPEWKL